MSMITTHTDETNKSFPPEMIESLREQNVPRTDRVDSYQVDVLGQLHANISQLQELHHRLSFMVKEISTLIKKR